MYIFNFIDIQDLDIDNDYLLYMFKRRSFR